MASKLPKSTVEEAPAADCAHHWMLPAPTGGAITGVCKHCGAERDFSTAETKGWVSRPSVRQR